ncbi:MAG: DUF389 domain-containing protein [Sphingobacteriales bacterium]|nr:DUF389 domain-containing protein [Sphingobacteriales bacterium]
MTNFFSKFRLGEEKEAFSSVAGSIEAGIVFRGTNLWILIFAIFVASLGLNVNSTAVIIGAMLISPLMGPIMGIGFAVGINDSQLLRKAGINYGVATLVALLTSTCYFLLSPLDEAHSELLARTAPTIYDVLIALFGGFAGIIALSSKQKGNVLPGVAIATALMPPLCTAGYGLATAQFSFFFGAFYLYIINTVFIALASFMVIRIFHFPYKKFTSEKAERLSRRIIWVVVLLTFLPSLYFGYDLVQQNRFSQQVNRFINQEAQIPGDYLLSKKISGKERSILLIYGGNEISAEQAEALRSRLPFYGLSAASLEIRQGFASYTAAQNGNEDEKTETLTKLLQDKQQELDSLKSVLSQQAGFDSLGRRLFTEINIQYPGLRSCAVKPLYEIEDSGKVLPSLLVLLSFNRTISSATQLQLHNWLAARTADTSVQLIIKP